MTIEEAIKISKTKNPLANGSTKYAQQILNPNEEVKYAINTNVSLIPITGKLNDTGILSIKNKINGVIVVTNYRIFFCSSIIGKKIFKEITLNKVESIDDTSNPLLGTGQLRIKGTTEMLVIDCKIKNINAIKEHLHQIHLPNQISSITPADEIKKYKELLDNGAITQEEFNIKKEELLK